MLSHPILGVTYSDKYFSPETIDRFFSEDFGSAPLTSAKDSEALEDMSLEQVFAQEWQNATKDEFVEQALLEAGITQESAMVEFQTSLNQDLESGTDQNTKDNMKILLQMSEEDGSYIYTVDGEPVLTIPVTHEGALMARDNTKVAFRAAFVFFDAIMLIAAAINVKCYYDRQKLEKAGFFKRLLNRIRPSHISQLRKIADYEKGAEKALFIARILRGFPGIKQIIMEMFSGMKKWEKALSLLNLTASIALLCASGGASLAAKIVSLTASFAVFTGDIVLLIAALNE